MKAEMSKNRKLAKREARKARIKQLCKQRKKLLKILKKTEETSELQKDKQKKRKASSDDDNLHTPFAKKKKESEDIKLLPPEVFEERNRLFKIWDRGRMKLPSIRLNLTNTANSNQTQPPVFFLSDVQHLITFIQNSQHAIQSVPKWVKVFHLQKIPVALFLIVDGIGADDIRGTDILDLFKINFKFVSPLSYGGSVVQELSSIPLSTTQKNNLINRYGSLQVAQEHGGKIVEVMSVIRSMFKVKNANNDRNSQKKRKDVISPFEPISHPENDNFPRTDIILTPWQMVQENYPLPIYGERYKYFVPTKDEYDEVTAESPMYAVDCEMCMTVRGSELTRISIVNEDHEVVLETLVQPRCKIINYLTEFSGITKEMLEGVTTTLQDVQETIRNLLPSNAILVGQSLNSDLQALRMIHPYVIDTSTIFNLSGIRNLKTKLRVLVEEFLSERIQNNSDSGHDSIEDAVAALKLVQLKLKHSVEWGDSVLGGDRSTEEVEASRALLRQRDKQGAQTALPHKTPTAHLLIKSTRECPPEQYSKDSDSREAKECYGISLFQHLTAKNQYAGLIAPGDILDEYVSGIPTTVKVGQHDSRLMTATVKNNKGVVKEAIRAAVETVECERRQVLLAHLDRPRISKLIKWVRKVLDSVPEHALLGVVLTGSKESSGLCLLTVKSTQYPQLEEFYQMHLTKQ